jgi:glycosyltransferase involved in cell wall biosynthesis
MRVAILTDNDFAKINGVTTTLRAVLKHAPPDIRPRVYTLSDVGLEEPSYLALKAPGMAIPFYPAMRMYWPRLGTLARHLAADRAELVHVTTPGPAGLAARALVSRLGLPLVGSFHTHLAEYTTVLSGSGRLGSWMNLYMRWLYGRCQRLLVPSVDTLLRLRHAGWDGSRLGVWRRGVDTDLFTPARRSAALRESWGVSAARPAILYAGRLSAEKGLARLAGILGYLNPRRIDARLIVVGDGPMASELREQCPDAIFMGEVPHDQVGAVMASADLFVFPSDTDTAGNVVLEAQASGLPVLVSRLGGPREHMLDGDTGVVCDPAAMVDFARRTAQLVVDGERRAAMGEAARRYSLTRTWDAALQPLFAAYRGALVPVCDGGSITPLAPAGIRQ